MRLNVGIKENEDRMKALTWNINGRSSKGGIPKMVIEELVKTDADIVCLTEFVKSENYHEFIDELISLGYETFTDPRTTDYSRNNTILLAIKSAYAVETDAFVICNDDNNPNFLHVMSRIDGNNHHFIGTRIKIGGEKNLDDDFKNRRIQLNRLVDEIRKIKGEPVVVLGDFNNGWFTDSQNKDSYSGKPRQFYSYPLLVEEMKSINFQANTPKTDCSWGNGFKLDHAFTNDLVEVKNVVYSWKFEQNPEYKKNNVGYPDHAMLITEISSYH